MSAPPTPEPAAEAIRELVSVYAAMMAPGGASYLESFAADVLRLRPAVTSPAAPPDEAKALEAAKAAYYANYGRDAGSRAITAACRVYHAALSAPPRTEPSEEAVRAGRYAYDNEALRDGTNVTELSWIYPILRAAYAVDFGAGAPERALSPQEIERVATETLRLAREESRAPLMVDWSVIVARVVASLTPRTEDAKQ